MGSKVYLLVESDRSQCDPLSRMIKDLVGQLKHGSNCWKPPYLTTADEQICVKIPEPKATTTVEKDVCCPKICCEPPSRVVYVACDPKPVCLPVCCTPPPCPPCPPKSSKKPASIAAEACIDEDGRANARIFVNGRKVVDEKLRTSDKPSPCPPTFCVMECPPPTCCIKECPPALPPFCEVQETPPKREYPWCKKRNGLDPTQAELRGMPKFEYLPYCCKIPEYKPCKVVERPSTGSASSINPRSRKYQENLAAMKDCARNLTEARLVKYNTCTRMRNGLQDKCDPLVKRTLASCCKKC